MHNTYNEALALLGNAYFFYPFIAIMGLIVGSFLNVVIYRLPRMMEHGWYLQSMEHLASQKTVEITVKPLETPQKTVRYNLFLPASHCRTCQNTIRPWENIPVLSYVFLRGRCSHCKSKIPLRYPAVELLTAVLSVFVAYHYGPTVSLLPALLFTWLMISLTFIDIDTQLLPDELTLIGLWAGLLLSVYGVFIPPTDAIIGAIVGYLIFWTLYWVYKFLTHKEGIGYGDFKLMALAGAWVGWQYLPIVVLISSFTGAIWGLASISMGITHKDHPMPFGPFIALAAWVTLLFGEPMVTTYLQWVR